MGPLWLGVNGDEHPVEVNTYAALCLIGKIADVGGQAEGTRRSL